MILRIGIPRDVIGRGVTVLRCIQRCSSVCRVGAGQPPKFGDLPVDQQDRIDCYLDLLMEWNTRVNLTAVRGREEAYIRHIDDSLALLPVLDECLGKSTDGKTLIDVGSGAGLPGLIIAIARPQWRVLLLDSLQKRCSFNEAAIETVGVSNVDVYWGRAEEAGQDVLHREKYDVAIARAVAELRVLAEYCLPLVKVGGHWIAAKGSDPEEEVATAKAAVKALGGHLARIDRVESYVLHDDCMQQRTAVVVEKSFSTPRKFPRKPGIAKKQPL